MTSDKTNTAGEAAEDKTKPTTPACPDWAAINARIEAQRAEARAQLKTERASLLPKLRALGIEEIEGRYDGYADSGNVGDITISPEGAQIADLEPRLKDFVWDIAYNLNPGFEINEGGEGTVTWNVVDDRIDVDHANFYTGRDVHLHEDV